jgi:hypothetical protein
MNGGDYCHCQYEPYGLRWKIASTVKDFLPSTVPLTDIRVNTAATPPDRTPPAAASDTSLKALSGPRATCRSELGGPRTTCRFCR